MAVGGVLALVGLAVSHKQFLYAWLLAFMFYLSLMLGATFLVMMHHLFDASWSVGIRREITPPLEPKLEPNRAKHRQ